jgi:hypothetical protein
MTKAELEKEIVKSFPIYELLQIRIEGQRYPRRRISQQRLGFFDTKEHAEEAMLSTIEFQKRVCKERGNNYYDDCFGFFLLEQFVHNRDSSFYRNERPQECFSSNADGVLNDFVALDEMGWYRGRKIEDIRFKVGDIVEVVDGNYADLGIVGALPLTTDKYSRLEEDPEECEHPSHFLDESDDWYLVYTLGEVGSHTHPVCYSVFPPTHPVPEIIAAQLRACLPHEQIKKE